MKWLLGNWDQVLVALGQHVAISLMALSIAFALSLVLGIWAARNDRVLHAALAVSGLLYTIPTLAFLALLIPLFPFVVIGVCIWLLTRNSRAATVSQG